MQQVRLSKVTLNIGVGEGGDTLANAKMLLERISGAKAVVTNARDRNPTFKVRKGDPLGVKATIRGNGAMEVVRKAVESREGVLPQKCIDRTGNVAFGVREYIDFPGMKYDPKIGMMGFDVCLTLEKAGARIAKRKVRRSKLPVRQRPTKQEAREFMEKNFGAKFGEAQAAE